MSKPRWLKQVEEKAVAKPVLLVEGNTDLRILSYFLEQVSPGWAAQIVMLPAKRKSKVIEGIQTYHPEWVGIVDKDEWPVDRTVEVLQDTPRVKALPRFCLENYFCVPDELWAALPSTSKQRLKNRPNRLKGHTEKVAHLNSRWLCLQSMPLLLQVLLNTFQADGENDGQQ